MEISMKAIIENIQHFSLHDVPEPEQRYFLKAAL